MAASKIAPTLAWILDLRPGRRQGAIQSVSFHEGLGYTEAAQQELRALLRVARAADKANILHDGAHTVGTRPRSCAGCALMAGLSDLARASGARSRKGGR